MKSLRDKGRVSALDSMPDLDVEAVDLWNMFAYMGDNPLVSLDIYAKRIGLPPGWDFDECMQLINTLTQKRTNLTKKE